MKATFPLSLSHRLDSKKSIARRPISSTNRHDLRFNDICEGREKGQDASRCNRRFLSLSHFLSIHLSLTTRFATKRRIFFSVSSSANRCREAAICLVNNRRSVHFRTLRGSAEQHTGIHTYKQVAGYDVYAIRCSRLPRVREKGFLHSRRYSCRRLLYPGGFLIAYALQR